jgi:flagellar basal-body rod protein FlgF
MIKGLYAAASAMLAGVTRQQAIAHDVANMETPGFKQVLTSLKDFMNTNVNITNPNDPNKSFTTLGRLGLGVESVPDTTDFSQGAMMETGNPLDLALDGPGFFRVKTPDGERLTRDGRFILDTSGSLVTIDGYAVLNSSGAPIKLADGEVNFADDGTITVNGDAAGQLGIVSFLDPRNELVRDDNNTFIAKGTATGTEKGVVVQSYLESSNSNTASLMTQLVQVTRSYEAAQQLVSNQDELLGKTISSLGRIG